MNQTAITATPRSRYSAGAIVLHWAIALLILANIALGWRMGRVTGLAQFQLFQLHKSIGITVLLLTLIRIGWRLSHPRPPYPASMTPWERRAASGLHGGFYAFMLVLPLTGWVIVSASLYNLPTLLFGTMPWPHIGFVHTLPTATRKLFENRVGVVHEWLAWTMLALIGLHVAAALKHQWFDRDDVLAHMLPFVRRRHLEP